MVICQGITKAGQRCKLRAKYQKNFCHHHLSTITNNPNQNLREKLANIEENRMKFIGNFKRIGSKPGGLTILLINIYSSDDAKKILSDHSWFNFTKGFKDLGHLLEGDKISFTARVKKYEKGDQTFDYRFSMPRQIMSVDKSLN